MIGRSPRWSERLQPVIQVLASFPAPMLFPLVTALLFLLHVNFNIGCTVLMLLGTQWYILFNVIAGASSIPADLQEVASVYRWSRIPALDSLYIPVRLPVPGDRPDHGGRRGLERHDRGRIPPNAGSDPYMAFGLGSVISQATNRRGLLAPGGLGGDHGGRRRHASTASSGDGSIALSRNVSASPARTSPMDDKVVPPRSKFPQRRITLFPNSRGVGR